MKKEVKLLLALVIYLGVSHGMHAQFSNQGITANYAGGTISGGSLETQLNTGQFGGIPTSEDFGIYLGLTAFNLQSGTISIESTFDQDIISDDVEGILLRLEEFGTYDSIDIVANAGGEFSFNPVFAGDYLVIVDSDPQKYTATYFGNSFLWEEAEVLTLAADTTVQIAMISTPTIDDPSATGNVSGTIEEDFGDDEARADTRRRAKKRKCGLRRRRTGGRIGQEDDVFELIAYGETNDNGEFEYGFLPEGRYRFFVEYPGIPLNESAFVEFDIGEAGVADDTFVLAVFASPDGIEIEIVLGLTSDYFVDFSIYPNPTTDLLNIEYAQIKLEAVRMEIVNMEGKVLYSRELSRTNDQIQYDTSLLRNGQYFVRFIGGGNEEPLVYKVIKK